MHTKLCDLLGIEFPVFAFSHCRDVVAAVTNAGGMGVMGASTHSPDQLETDLRWLDESVGGRPYGIDFLFPSRYEGDDQESLRDRIPEEHTTFVRELEERFDIPDPKESGQAEHSRVGDAQITLDRAMSQWEVSQRYGPSLVASALGPPPSEVVEEARARGQTLVGLVGAPEHVRHQRDRGVDILVAQGHEAAGHTGEITSLVLVPQIVDAADGLPVVAAGGIGDGRQVAAALALGAQGVWTGSIWLTTAESDTDPMVKRKLLGASSRDTILSRCSTGKPARQLLTEWVEAWESDDAPEPLPAPLQGLLVRDALVSIHEHKIEPAMGTYVGEIAGMMLAERSAKDVLFELIEEYLETVARLNTYQEE